MILYTKHTQALERCTNSKEEKEVVQKGLSHTSESSARCCTPRGVPSALGHALRRSPRASVTPKASFYKEKYN